MINLEIRVSAFNQLKGLKLCLWQSGLEDEEDCLTLPQHEAPVNSNLSYSSRLIGLSYVALLSILIKIASIQRQMRMLLGGYTKLIIPFAVPFLVKLTTEIVHVLTRLTSLDETK